jgi:hypothetical protein
MFSDIHSPVTIERKYFKPVPVDTFFVDIFVLGVGITETTWSKSSWSTATCAK